MQKIYSRTNPMPFEVSEKSNARPIPQIDAALPEFARHDISSGRVAVNAASGNLSSEPQSSVQVVADIISLVERVAGVSLDQLDDVIVDLRQLRDSLHSEGERIQREIADYLQLSQTAMGSTKMIADNIVLWNRTAHNTARTREKRSAVTERADFVAPATLPLPSPTAAKDIFIPPK
jgi:hypothetical protein